MFGRRNGREAEKRVEPEGPESSFCHLADPTLTSVFLGDKLSVQERLTLPQEKGS